MNRTPSFRTLPWWTWLLVVLAAIGLLILSIQALRAEDDPGSPTSDSEALVSPGSNPGLDLIGTGKRFTLLT